MNLINLPYCFLFIPLIFSCLNILQNYKTTNTIITVSVVSFILFLSFFLIPEVLPNLVLANKINDEVLFIPGEYKINLKNLIFIILIFFIKLVSFMFFDDETVSNKKLNFFFAIYLINYFAVCGILISNNIFNIFLYIEFYSFTLYNLMSGYKQKDYTTVSYQYFNNGVIGSIFLMFFVFIVYFTFGSADIDYITQNIKIVEKNYLYHLSIIIFLFGILFKFFSFNSYFSSVVKSSDITNLLFINILFSDIIIGIYILWKFLYSLFDLNIIFNIFHISYIFYFIGSALILYSSYKIFIRKNLLPNIYSFSLITLGYIIILIGMNNAYSFVAIISFLINHVLINFLFYIIIALFIYLFGKSDTPILYSFYKYKYIIYCIVLSKLTFPIAFGFNSYWNFLLSVIQEKAYFLIIPFLFEKMVFIFLLTRYYLTFSKEPKDAYNYFELDNKISLNTNYMMSICIVFALIIGISFCEGAINDILFNFINIKN